MGEAILAAGNHEAGVPGTAAQAHYLFTGVDGTGAVNDCSQGLRFSFPSVQEYWFRFYMKFPESGYSFDGNPYFKVLYNDLDQGGAILGIPQWPNSSSVYLQGTGQSCPAYGYGNDWLESNGRQGWGRWIPVEIHLKNDTNGADGVVQLWIDDVLVADYDDRDFGFTHFDDIRVGSNHNVITGIANTSMPVYFDDFFFATADYTGFVDDGNGNDRIGLDAGLSASEITAPTNLTATKVE